MLLRISAVLLLSLAAACAQANPPSRDQVAENLTPMLTLEQRVDRLKYYAQWLVRIKGIDEARIVELKARHDVYFVYYLAANVDLASGNLTSYHANVKRAENELDSMEATLKAALDELSRSDPNAKESRSQSDF